MDEERLVLPKEGEDVIFVRAGDRFATGPFKARHRDLVEKLTLKPEQIRQADVDMGLISRDSTLVLVGGNSYGYSWPPKDMPELRQQIRDDTVSRIKALFPNLEVSGY